MDMNIKIKTTTWNNKKNNKNNIISRKEQRRFCEAYARRLAHGGYRQLIVES